MKHLYVVIEEYEWGIDGHHAFDRLKDANAYCDNLIKGYIEDEEGVVVSDKNYYPEYEHFTGGILFREVTLKNGDETMTCNISSCEYEEYVDEDAGPKWYNIFETPEPGNPIVYISKNGKMGVIKERKEQGADWERTWDFYTKKYNIIAWAYQTDLFPNWVWPIIYPDNKEEE